MGLVKRPRDKVQQHRAHRPWCDYRCLEGLSLSVTGHGQRVGKIVTAYREDSI